MTMTARELGIIGLGTMGGNLARQATDEEIRVVGMNRSPRPELESIGVRMIENGDFDAFAAALDRPRAIYLSLPAGPTIGDELDALVPHLDEGDVVLDGGNSYFRDSMRRAHRAAERDVYFLDCGTSGGWEGARHGACFMVGGSEEGFEIARPVLERLAVDGGVLYTGPSGSGHYVKLVHNGIEFGMLQAIGEGIELLTDGEFDLDLPAVFDNWSNGSVIRSWLVDLMGEQLRERGLDDVPNYIEDTGEVNWLVEEALKSETPIPVISQSVMELFKSRGEQRNAYRAIAMMRHGFGDHPFGSNEAIQNERVTSRVRDESRLELSVDDIAGDRRNDDRSEPRGE
nr:NADP-dependent phosphogluconate dehydrogenase [Haladaptatus salinisoli]